MFTDRLRDNFTECRDKKALMYSDGSSYTYGELENISGRVCGWLKNSGIGREDVVLITMPRGIEILAAMVGVMRAGACYVVCESSMAVDRIRYIMEDSNSKKVITKDAWEEILKQPYSDFFAEPEPHDAAYIVYTSGTTGNPKGVVHEYGNYDQSIAAKQLEGKPICVKEDVLGLNSPLNFVAAVDYVVNVLNAGATILLVATNVVKNVGRLMELYEEQQVSFTFMTPSLYKSIPELSQSLKKILIGGEPCVGLYNDRIQLINGYNMSEAGRDMLLFKIDRVYETTPVGHNRAGEEIFLLDEDGNAVPDGEIGEVCYVNEYVRGYIGLPEKTAQAWRNGLYHTGDLGRRQDGEIVLLGRNDDMIKINGNRIEPTEIEMVSKKLLGLSTVVVKGFVTPERNFIVLYYTDEVELDPVKARNTLSTKLTSYMLPSYFVRLSEIPMLPNGKVNKKALEAPDLNAYRQLYEAPETETEKELVELFEKVLGIEHIGVTEDFYELGGDSLKCIKLISEYKKDGLDAQTVFKCRTARRIAAEIATNLEELKESGGPRFDSPEEKENYARTQSYPLTDFQTNMLDYQLFEPTSKMWNLEDMFAFDPETTDPDRLFEAVKKVADSTAIFKTRISFDDMCDLVEYIDEEAEPFVERIYMSDREFECLKGAFNHPFKMTGKPFIEVVMIQTETSLYLHFLAHHLIIDGKGLEALFDNIALAYEGKALPQDTFYSYLYDVKQLQAGRKYKEARQYFDKTYGRHEWCNCPVTDSNIADHESAAISVRIPVSGQQLEQIEERAGLSRSGLVTAAILLTMAADSGQDRVITGWVYHQRTDEAKKNAIGLLICQLPVGVDMSQLNTLADLYADVREKINAGMANSAYEWCLNNAVGFDDDMMLLVYEGSMFEWSQLSRIGGRPVPTGAQFGAADATGINIRKMFTMAAEDEQGIIINLNYLKNAYSREHIDKIQALFEKYAGLVFSDKNPGEIKL